MLTEYAIIPNVEEGVKLLRLLEDANYTSYDSQIDSSHNGILCGRFNIVGLWDDGMYVGYRQKEHQELSQGVLMDYREFTAMLKYKAGEPNHFKE